MKKFFGSEEAISNAYYSGSTEISRSYKEYMLRLIGVEPVQAVLDLGCGTGLNSERLSQAGFKLTGVDISPVAIEKYKAKGFSGFVADVTKGLPFPPNSFDAVFSSEVIEHINDTESFCLEIQRILKPKGVLYLSTPNSAFWPYRVLALLGKTSTEVQHPGHVRFFSRKLLSKNLEKAGFSNLIFYSRNIFLIFSLGENANRKIGRVLNAIGFNFERKFGTNSTLYHLSCLSKGMSTFWSDTMIVRAEKSMKPSLLPPSSIS